ncbi:MAG: DUF512 domain-containing protein [Bacillota bacterium]
MVDIVEVHQGSIADELGLTPGDILLNINGQTIKDYIDFKYITASDNFIVTIEKPDGQRWELDIEKAPDENLGIVLDGIIYNELKSCKNNCLFCFVKQQPMGMRQTLMMKDDDYRFSFLQGSFITLTNIDKNEMDRIIRLNLSPLYISVHTTNPQLRIEMMKNTTAGEIMHQLKTLSDNGIDFHTQIVLCPGYNDREELDNSIKDLISLYPGILSIGVVPVGLTNYRETLTDLNRYEKNEAVEVINQIERWQNYLMEKYKKNILYAADEFYFLADKEIPEYDEYNGFPQLENGIGLTRLLWKEFSSLEIPEAIAEERDLGIITGILGNKALMPIIKRLNDINNLNINTIPVKNKYFGESVTVTGLLTGGDIIMSLDSLQRIPENIIIPRIVLNERGFFLDDLSIIDIDEKFSDVNFYLAGDITEMLEVIVDG